MAPPKKANKHVIKLDTPFSAVTWPETTAKDQNAMLEMLCSLLAPIGRHHTAQAEVTRAKSKRRRRNNDNKNKHKQLEQPASDPIIVDSVNQHGPPPPGITHHITLGLNSTSRHLTTSKTPSLAAIFFPSPPHHLIHAHFPLLALQANTKTRIVSFTATAQNALKRLTDALQLPRIGVIGIMEGAPGAEALLTYVQEQVPATEVPPMLAEAVAGGWLGMKVVTETDEARREGRQRSGGAETEEEEGEGVAIINNGQQRKDSMPKDAKSGEKRAKVANKKRKHSIPAVE